MWTEDGFPQLQARPPMPPGGGAGFFLMMDPLLSQFRNLALAGTVSDMDGRDDSIVYGLHRLDITW